MIDTRGRPWFRLNRHDDPPDEQAAEQTGEPPPNPLDGINVDDYMTRAGRLDRVGLGRAVTRMLSAPADPPDADVDYRTADAGTVHDALTRLGHLGQSPWRRHQLTGNPEGETK